MAVIFCTKVKLSALLTASNICVTYETLRCSFIKRCNDKRKKSVTAGKSGSHRESFKFCIYCEQNKLEKQ